MKRSRVLVTFIAALALAAGAVAYFTASGIGTAAVSIGTLSAPGSPAASASGSNVSVTWTASTLNPSLAASSYAVERYDSSGNDLGAASCSPVSSSAGSPNAFGTFTCTDAPSSGTYKYKISAHYAGWTATTAFTNTVTSSSNPTALTASGPATDATGTLIPGTSISGTLSGATPLATGTITFTVFGPQATAPTSCVSGGTAVGTASVSGNGTYHPSAGYTPTTAGTYWWYASYGGDSNNGASTSTCGSGMSSTVVKNTTSTTASAPSTGTAGTAITASAISSVVSGATAGAGGTISFRIFGPQASAPTTCTSGGTAVGTASVSGNGTYHPSASFTPTTAGTYWWYASYDGDLSNSASSSTCGTGMASTVVGKATTATTVSAPSSGMAGTAIAASSISSTLSGGASPTGTITIKVVGPQSTAPTDCTGGTTVGTASVTGNGAYNPSGGFTPTLAGTYWWYASYAGDLNNNGSSSTCGAGMTSTVVTTINTTTTTVSAPGTDNVNTAIAASSISSTLSGGASPTGTITFKVFGPQSTAPTTCTSGGTTVGTATVSGNNTYHPSAGYTPSTAGTYWWYASYGGDSSNAASASTCGAGMTSTVAYSFSFVASGFDSNGNKAVACTSFTLQPSTSYLMLVYRHEKNSGDSITSVTGTGTPGFTNPPSFTAVTQQSFNPSTNNWDYEWAEVATTASNAGGTGTLTANFTNGAGGSNTVSIIDVVQLTGNDTTTPIVTSNEKTTSGTGTSATANLPSAPDSHDAGIVFLSGESDFGASAPTASPAMTNLGSAYSHQTQGSAGVYEAFPAAQSESFSWTTSQPWGTIALEIKHG